MLIGNRGLKVAFLGFPMGTGRGGGGRIVGDTEGTVRICKEKHKQSAESQRPGKFRFEEQ